MQSEWTVCGCQFLQKNGTNRKFTSTLSLGNLEENIVDFSLADNNIYSINRNINSTISIAEYDEFINGEWVLYNYLPIDHNGNQVYTKIEVAGDKMFLGSTWYIVAETAKFPILY